MDIYITDKGRAHLQDVMQTRATIDNIYANKIHYDVILFHLDNGEELDDIFMKLVDAAPGSNPDQASRKFKYELDQAEGYGYIEGDSGLGDDYEAY